MKPIDVHHRHNIFIMRLKISLAGGRAHLFKIYLLSRNEKYRTAIMRPAEQRQASRHHDASDRIGHYLYAAGRRNLDDYLFKVKITVVAFSISIGQPIISSLIT